MTPSQVACLDAMQIDRWVPRDEPGRGDLTGSGLTLVIGTDWRVVASQDEVGEALLREPSMRLLGNILRAIGIEPRGASFTSVDLSTLQRDGDSTRSLAFLGDQSPSGWCELPTLSEMLTKPTRKRDAWEILQEVTTASALE